MATLTLTFTAGSEAGATMRALSNAIEKAVGHMPDKNATGASTVITFDNAPSTGTVSVQVTAGPYSLMPDGSTAAPKVIV